MPATDETGSVLADYGPLGGKKGARQLGRSVRLEAAGGRTRAEVLVYTGAAAPNNFSLDPGDALAATCTITTGIIQQGMPADQPVAVIEGSLEWGTDGTSQSARFDWRNGGVIIVAGSSFKVSAELLSIPEDSSVEVCAFIGYYHAGCPCEARLTRTAVPGGVVLPIPSMAHAVLPIVDDVDGATLQFTRDVAGAIPLFGAVTYAAGTAPINRGLKVPPGAGAVLVTTAAAAMPIVFELSL